ncbi:MAG: hypothetical protein COW13_02040 [Candidatus Omnitrophica bacterium CG12_big_fil_rev_8_21_14_0_65_50_5]|nr:MAG: hypothetical protein COW13_02040 [Candidatus Omnitrophica bacterium CG12_big_fil_rev_8_21_14_0_65_50_5]
MTSLNDIRKILDNPDPRLTEQLAQQSAALTRQYFGRTIALYAPVYLSNYCSSHCTYCGFHSKNNIKRARLTPEQTEKEMRTLAQTGIENVLLLTGESYKATPVSYLKEAVVIAKKYFTGISIEVYPMEVQEFRELF